MENYQIHFFTLLMIVIITNELPNSSMRSEEKFTFVVLADPQAYRLTWDCTKKSTNQSSVQNRENPNEYNEEWCEINENLVKVVNEISSKRKLDFAIINGDITEYGKAGQWKNYFKIYGELELKKYIGLGNHDYSNNVGDCFVWFSMKFLLFGLDACAAKSAFYMLDYLAEYATDLKEHNFRRHLNGGSVLLDIADFLIDNYSPKERLDISNSQEFEAWMRLVFPYYTGSFSYSWDWKGVHFVQLQNYPLYEVKISKFWIPKFVFISSLAWLAEDLKWARSRGVRDIILNFHQYEHLGKEATEKERMFLKALMDNYKPIAVFLGRTHCFNKYEISEFFANATVYVTGAAFKGWFHVVTYNKGELLVEQMASTNGILTQLEKYRTLSQIHKPVCRVGAHQIAQSGTIFASRFMPLKGEWNIRHNEGPTPYLASDKYGFIFTSKGNITDDNLKWIFAKAPDNRDTPEFWARYLIVDKSSGRYLTISNEGYVTTRGKKARDSRLSHWTITKMYGDSQILIINSATNLVLHIFNMKPVVRADNRRYYSKNKKFWQITNPETGKPLENVRYFMAKHDNSWTWPLPKGNKSNKHWKFLKTHNFLEPSPCIGW